MAVLALLKDIANSRIQRERVFRDLFVTDFLAYDWLISRFRIPRAILLELCTDRDRGIEGWRWRDPYPVVGDQELSHCVALALILSLDLNGDVPVDHRPVAGPVLGTLLL